MDDNKSVASIKRRIIEGNEDASEILHIINLLIKFKARTQTICSIFSNTEFILHERDIGRMYKEVHGQASGRGFETYLPKKLLATYELTYHASVYFALYEKYKSIFKMDPRARVEAYSEYLRLFETTVDEAILKFTNAFKITQYIETGDIVKINCHTCKTIFVHPSYTPLLTSMCPCCEKVRKFNKLQPNQPQTSLISQLTA